MSGAFNEYSKVPEREANKNNRRCLFSSQRGFFSLKCISCVRTPGQLAVNCRVHMRILTYNSWAIKITFENVERKGKLAFVYYNYTTLSCLQN